MGDGGVVVTEQPAWPEAITPQELLRFLAYLHPEAAVFAIDADRRIVSWSEGAEALLGFSEAEVLGEHCLKCNRCVSCMQSCGLIDYGTVRDVPIEIYRADGSAVKVRKTGYAVRSEDDTFLGGVEVLFPDRSPPAAAPSADRPRAASVRSAIATTDEVTSFHGIWSGAPAMRDLFETIRRVAGTEVSVLVRGESGSGKELVARAIHNESPRASGPFVAVNCAALTPSLLESELFGHVRGAFTGAVSARAGLFEQAHGGTLFLDEIAELPLDVQAKLLRVLEASKVVRVGGTRAVDVDVRIVAATHRSLRKLVSNGNFREDLMYRLRVVPLFLPPLRDRSGDVPLLLKHFIDAHNGEGGRQIQSIHPDAMRVLLEHRWPGNVRELKNVVAYAQAVGRGPEIRIDDLPPEFREAVRRAPRPVLQVPEGADEATRIQAALDATGGHVGRAAELLGMSRPTFWRKRKKLGL